MVELQVHPTHVVEHASVCVLQHDVHCVERAFDDSCRQIIKEPSATALPQHDEAISADQQQPSALRRNASTTQQSDHGPLAQRQGLLQHTGLQSKAAQMVMQQRQAHLHDAPASNLSRSVTPKRSGT